MEKHIRGGDLPQVRGNRQINRRTSEDKEFIVVEQSDKKLYTSYLFYKYNK